MDRQRFLIPALALLMVWRLALLPTVELCPDEALAVLYAQRPALWHVEMGPLTPWLVGWSTQWCGETELGVRLLAPVLAFMASICVWRLGHGLFNATVASWAVVILQVVPAFNVAATTMTSSITGFTALCGLVLCLRIGLHRAHPNHVSWKLGAVCLALAIFADWRNGLAYLCVIAALGISPRRRHHLKRPGFLLLSVGFAAAFGCFLWWNQMQGWPMWHTGEAEPHWAVAPNVLRWMVLLSPVIASLMVWTLIRSTRWWRSLQGHGLLLAFAVPFAVMDLAYGPTERWPHMGWPLWMALSTLLLADHSLGSTALPMSRKILLRTGGFLLAALFSICLLRTDMIRSMGVAWRPVHQAQPRHIWEEWFRLDPAGGMMGWRLGASALHTVLRENKPPSGDWWVIASDWQLAAATEFYLPADAPVLRPLPEYPRVHTVQAAAPTSPHSLWKRYDSVLAGEDPFSGRDALYLTDDAEREHVPGEIARMFQRTEVLTILRVVHGGQVVRHLKIFACHGWRAPEW
jgi:hypothetical protein